MSVQYIPQAFPMDSVALREYFPKVARHVVGNHALNRHLICTTQELQVKQTCAEILKLINGTALPGSRSGVPYWSRGKAPLAEAFQFFLGYLSAKRYRYVSDEGAYKFDPVNRGPVADKRRYDEIMAALNNGLPGLNIFFHPTAPIGNCLETARAFATLLIFLGWTTKEIQLALILPSKDPQKNQIAYTDEAVQAGLSTNHKGTLPSNYVSTVLEAKDSTKGVVSLAAVNPDRIDTPFGNHWVVKANGMLWDGNYGFAYSDPNALFEEWSFEGDVKTFGETTQYGLYMSPDRGRCLVNLPAALDLSHGRPITKTQNNYLFTPQAAWDTVTLTHSKGAISLPRNAARLFGWCVPDADFLVKPLLMQAVRAYEDSTGFFRSPSEDSKASLRKIRKYCGEEQIQSRTVADRLYRNINWAGEKTWSDGEAPERIYALLGLDLKTQRLIRPPVGKRLWEELCDAFEVPNWLTQKIPRPA